MSWARFILLIVALALLQLLDIPHALSQERIRTVYVAGDYAHEPPPLNGESRGDNTDDAAGLGQIFELINVPGFTDGSSRTESGALVYMNGDDLLDIALSRNGEIEVYINQGGFVFAPRIFVQVERGENDPPVGNANYAATADFNNDGFPDFYVTGADGISRSQLLISKGSYTEYKDYSVVMGVTNPGAYARNGVSIADINGDGWLDIGISAKRLTSTLVQGYPHSQVYLFQPSPDGVFENGRFVEIGGTALLPGFGDQNEFVCNPETDYSSTMLKFRDLDGDRDLDLIQSATVDLFETTCGDCPCSPGEYRHGLLVWRNLTAETGGQFRFYAQPPGEGRFLNDNDAILSELGISDWDPELEYYVHQVPAISHTGGDLDALDLDNDGDLDIVSVGPQDPLWQLDIPPEQMGAKAWRNAGNWQFPVATEAFGLEVYAWDYDQWAEFWVATLNPSPVFDLEKTISIHRAILQNTTFGEQHIYPTSFAAADYDNDGWLDAIQVDRYYQYYDNNDGFFRNVFMRNDGTGRLAPIATGVSGISLPGMAGVAGDMNNDGRLDFVVFNRLGPNQIYWNTGTQGISENSWLQIRLTGRPEGELMGAQIHLYDQSTRSFLARRDLFAQDNAKTSQQPIAHFGLGGPTPPVRLAARVDLVDGTQEWFFGIQANRMVELLVAPAE